MKKNEIDSPKLHAHDRVERLVLALAERTLLCAQHTEFFQERGVFVDGEPELGLHHEVLDHGWRAPPDKARCGVEVLSKVGRNTVVSWTGGPATVEIIVRCGCAAELGRHVYLGGRVRLDFEDAEPGWVGHGRDGRARGFIAVALPLAVATAAGGASFDVVLETHVFGESVGAGERFVALCGAAWSVGTELRRRGTERGGVRTGELAGEGFLARVGSQVRDKCEARSLREATTGARGPFTGVVGFVHAYVICGGQKTSGRSDGTRQPS